MSRPPQSSGGWPAASDPRLLWAELRFMVQDLSLGQPSKETPLEKSWEITNRLDGHLWIFSLLLIVLLAAGVLSLTFLSRFWLTAEALKTAKRISWGLGVLLG